MSSMQLTHARVLAVVAAIAVLVSAPVLAQVSTANISGHVTEGTAISSGATITATNSGNGSKVTTQTDATGAYQIVGLQPGQYTIDVNTKTARRGSETVELNVGQNLGFDVDLQAKPKEAGQLEEVLVVGIRKFDKKTSEVSVNVTPVLINNLPQVTRNLLSFADLAPGVRFNVDPGSGHVSLQSGAQNQDNVNLFIDGVSQKNYVLRGGVAGMDSTRGNPFPQSAVAEYKIITQNYKAEYDDVSSVAITAITKSGTNEFHGDAFVDRTQDGWVAMSPYETQAAAQGVPRPSFKQEQFGFSIGGPLFGNDAHFFVAYEGKDIGQPRQIVVQNANILKTTTGGDVPFLLALQGSNDAKFKENMFLAKVDAQLSDSQSIEFSARIRRESDFVPEDMALSAPGNDKDRTNDETRWGLKHTWRMGSWLNEARLDYQDTDWNPRARSATPLLRWHVYQPDIVPDPPVFNDVRDLLFTGGSPDAQDRAQKGLELRDDLTFTGRANHTFKGGVRFNHLKFDLSGTANAVPICDIALNAVTGVQIAPAGVTSPNCGTDYAYQIQPALEPVAVSFSDNQIGLYFQDDWEVSAKLLLNLGVRWDYETNMLNNDYVTPADRVAALTGLDGPRWGITPPPGQTYAQSLAKGGINITDYISTGSSRKPFATAIAPRLGASYDLFGDRRSVIFGGMGRAYDRKMANNALDELQKNAQAGGEIWLVRNDYKMPYTDQFGLGLRQALGTAWNGEIGVTRSYSHNQFNWFGGNRDANGGWATQSPIDPLWGGPVGYGTLILGDFISKAKTQTTYLKADKPYSPSSGWGLTVVYTYSDAQTTNREWTNDIFNWTYGKPGAGWNPSADVEKHRIVVAGLTDRLIPWGVMLSGKLTYGSGLPFRVTSCAAGWDQCTSVEGHGGPLRQVDMGLSKNFKVWRGQLGLRADVLNLFNTINYGGYDSWGGGPGNPQNIYGGDNPNVGKPSSIATSMRTFKLTVTGHF